MPNQKVETFKLLKSEQKTLAATTLEDKIRTRELVRQEYWSKAIAVGNSEWLENISGSMGLKRYKIQNADPGNLDSDCYIGKN